jgi:tRNA-specific 2-thiouridylase
MTNISRTGRSISGNKKKVFVGMSGGVDSSVSAALLKKAGYDVTGVFIKVWQPDEEVSGLRCTWREDRLDAMRVAAVLGIKFATLDLEKEYKKNVVDYMIAEYRAGRTPNPDIMCNKYVKFGSFFTWAIAQGADYVATGHYAQVEKHLKNQIVEEEEGKVYGISLKKLDATSRIRQKSKKSDTSVYDIVAGDDANKDQSYFLWTLTQEQLSRTLFPVGNIAKPEVRKLAKKFGLPTAEKKDSQGLCFIGKIDVKEFLSYYIEPKKGNVLDTTGKTIGSHAGAFFFTLGERHGFIIDGKNKTPHDEPFFVIGKNIADNTITVSDKLDGGNSAFEKKEIRLSEVNWTRGFRSKVGAISLTARPRYRAPLVPISISEFDPTAQTCIVTFKKPQSTLSPGQSLVIYDGPVCLGGGIIS